MSIAFLIRSSCELIIVTSDKLIRLWNILIEPINDPNVDRDRLASIVNTWLI